MPVEPRLRNQNPYLLVWHEPRLISAPLLPLAIYGRLHLYSSALTWSQPNECRTATRRRAYLKSEAQRHAAPIPPATRPFPPVATSADWSQASRSSPEAIESSRT